MKTKIYQMIMILCVSLFFTSCMTTKTSVGSYREKQGNEYTYDKGKQFWLFWGLIPITRTNVSTPTDGSCEIITKFRVGDAIIIGLTGGILTTYSIKVKAKK
jgi:hypothetical protein